MLTLEIRQGYWTWLLSGDTIEERQQNGETVRVIEGTLDASTDPANPEYQSEINGTLTPDGSDLILEDHGVAGSPYDLE